jgi:oligopeptidase B
MLGRIKEDDQTVPYRWAGHLYYSRTETGKPYPIYCRRAPVAEAPEAVVLDLNVLGQGRPFIALGVYAVSDDGRWLAYSLDPTGFREYTLYVKDLDTGRGLPETVSRAAGAAWAADSCHLFYVTEDEAKRPWRLWRHRLGTPVEADVLLYEERDALFRLHVWRSRSRALLFAASGSFTSTETRALPATEPLGTWRLLLPREADHEHQVDHWTGPGGERLWIRTSGGGRRNFRLVTAPLDDPRPERWVEVLPHRADVMLEDVDVFAGHVVVHERENGLARLRVLDLGALAAGGPEAWAGASHHVAFPEPAYDLSPEPNPDFAATRYRFRYESLVTPPSVFDYDVVARERTLLKQTEVRGGYDGSRYRAERLHAPAADGTPIPISLVCRADTPRAGPGPLLLAGYGAYGIPYPVTFSSNRLSLLDRGVTVAVAHVRGGGEGGKRWHDQGRMLAKPTTFADFAAAADHLVRAGYTAADRLAIEGGSAGGLLIGAVLNRRPDLCRAAVLRVPFVDVINTMLDESLPLTVGEFEEWGNPKVPEHYACMRAYCPYTNLGPRAYPAVLVRTALHDSQVMYWEPAKYVARLREVGTGPYPVLFKINLAAGHGGASGRYDFLREIAFDYAFVLSELGLAEAARAG